MVAYDYETRLERMFDIVLPAIENHEDVDFQMSMIDKHKLITEDLNARCGYRVADIPQIFEDLRQRVRERQKDVERI